MVYQTPKLTPTEARRFKAAQDRLVRDLLKIRMASDAKLQKLQDKFQKDRAELIAKQDAAEAAAKRKFRDEEYEIFSPIFEEEARTGKRRERAA